MELWHIARFDTTQRYYLQSLSRKKEAAVYHWISNRYRAMFFYSELSIGGYINTYMNTPRSDIELGIVCFRNGKEIDTVAIGEFGARYRRALHQVILT